MENESTETVAAQKDFLRRYEPCPGECTECAGILKRAEEAAGVTREQAKAEVAPIHPDPEAEAEEDTNAPDGTFFARLKDYAAALLGDNYLTASDQEDLESQHNSLMDTIAAAPLYEGEFVLRRLRRGKVDGSTFGDGGRTCSCLLGTMATAANQVEKKHYFDGEDLGIELMERQAVYHGDAQELFAGINVGDKPSTSASAAIADQFITELLMSNRAELAREERAAIRKLERAFGQDRIR